MNDARWQEVMQDASTNAFLCLENQMERLNEGEAIDVSIIAEAFLQTIAARGFWVVPQEPTEQMIAAGWPMIETSWGPDLRKAWNAMLRASTYGAT